MSLARTARSSFVRRSFARPSTAPLAFANRRYAGDYGSGAGDPKGEKPQEQGANPSADKEHPGPPPPSAGQGTGGATKANSEGHNTGSSKQSGGSSSGSSKGTQGAQPKILNENPPKEGEASEDVQKHNRDMENRAERSHEKVNSDEDIEKDKVPKGFWSGQGGRDSDP